MKNFMRTVLINLGLWVARLGKYPDPPLNMAYMGFAKAGAACWEGQNMDYDNLVRQAYRTASALANADNAELRFAVARELYLRKVK